MKQSNENEQIVVDMKLWAKNKGLEFKKATNFFGQLYYLEDSSGHNVSGNSRLDEWTAKLDEHSDTILREIST